MSILAEYKATQAAIKELQDKIASMESNDKLKQEKEFEAQLRELMAIHGKALRDIVDIIDPAATIPPYLLGAPKQRKAREVKTYLNPNTNETLGTKGGNNRVLKAWKAQYGSDVVESWLVK